MFFWGGRQKQDYYDVFVCVSMSSLLHEGAQWLQLPSLKKANNKIKSDLDPELPDLQS